MELKGIDFLLSAAAVLRREFPGLRVEIAGSGPQHEKLGKMATQVGLGGQVKFLGWIDNLNSVLPRWDVFVMPSLEEGFGIAALEAMAAGLPVVATSVGGLPELIEDGKTGWLVPPAMTRLWLPGSVFCSAIKKCGWRWERPGMSARGITSASPR